MKIVTVVIVSGMLVVPAGRAYGQGGQAAQRRQDAVRRTRHGAYQSRRDDVKDRQVADEDAARAATLQKSEQTRATVQQQQSTTITQPSTSLQMRQRLALINTQLTRLEDEKRLAVESGKTAEEIAGLDAQMVSLRQEAAGLRTSLGLPAQ